MDIYEVTMKMHEISERIDQLAKAIKVVDDLACHAETVDTYNRCAAIKRRLMNNVHPLGDEFYKLKDEYNRLRQED